MNKRVNSSLQEKKVDFVAKAQEFIVHICQLELWPICLKSAGARPALSYPFEWSITISDQCSGQDPCEDPYPPASLYQQ